jgi:hypothetical protein
VKCREGYRPNLRDYPNRRTCNRLGRVDKMHECKTRGCKEAKEKGSLLIQ